jgi:hypothetical protein
MQFTVNSLLALFLFASTLVTASPIDRSLNGKHPRYVDHNVVWVTVTSAYTVTISSHVPQFTTTVTVHASFVDGRHRFGSVTTTSAETVTASPTEDPTPDAVIISTPSPDPPVADPIAAAADPAPVVPSPAPVVPSPADPPPADPAPATTPVAAPTPTTTPASTDSTTDGAPPDDTIFSGQGTFFTPG